MNEGLLRNDARQQAIQRYLDGRPHWFEKWIEPIQTNEHKAPFKFAKEVLISRMTII